MLVSAGRVLRAVVGVLAVGLVLTGCRIGHPPAAPPEEFGDFSVGLFGGVAGLQTVLRIRSDGVGVLAASTPVSGRIGAGDLARLRSLLTSVQFRREAAATAEQPPGSRRCSDLFIREVTMGSLSVRTADRCGDEERPATPAFDEILVLLGDELNGRFPAPVGSPLPRVTPLTLVREPRAGVAGQSIEVGRDGRLLRRTASGTDRRTLPAEERATVALLVDVVAEAPPRTCSAAARYRLTVRTSPVRTGADCTFQRRAPQFWALVRLLEGQFA